MDIHRNIYRNTLGHPDLQEHIQKYTTLGQTDSQEQMLKFTRSYRLTRTYTEMHSDRQTYKNIYRNTLGHIDLLKYTLENTPLWQNGTELTD